MKYLGFHEGELHGQNRERNESFFFSSHEDFVGPIFKSCWAVQPWSMLLSISIINGASSPTLSILLLLPGCLFLNMTTLHFYPETINLSVRLYLRRYVTYVCLYMTSPWDLGKHRQLSDEKLQENTRKQLELEHRWQQLLASVIRGGREGTTVEEVMVMAIAGDWWSMMMTRLDWPLDEKFQK